jgi:hypothetical protein
MARLNKEQLADRSRYQFKTEEVEIPELGGSVEVKTLSVKERDSLPDLVDEDGKPQASVENLAKVFSAVVSDPEVTEQEAQGFLGDLPATALDRVIEKFGELLGTSEEEAAEKRQEFRPQDD